MMTNLYLQDEVANENTVNSFGNSAPVETTKDPSSDSQISINGDLSLAVEVPLADIEDARSIGDNTLTAVAKNQAGFFFTVADQADAAYEEGKSVDEAANIVSDRLVKERDMSSSEFILSQGLSLTNEEVNPFTARTSANMAVWDRLMADEFDKNQQGIFSKFLTFLDVNILRQFTIGILDDPTFRSNREGDTIKDAFLNMNPAEFEVWAKDYIAERKDEGIFSGDSIWNLYKLANDSQYLGDDPIAPLAAILSAFDIVPIATAGVKVSRSGVRTLRNARRGVDALAVVADETTAAARLARQVERETVQIDKVTVSRTLPDDMDPSITRPFERPSGVTYREGTLKTRLNEAIDNLEKNGWFGEYLTDATKVRLITETIDNISRSVGDIGIRVKTVVDEGSQDFKTVLTFGREGTGGAFKTRAAAEEIAKRDPSLSVIKADGTEGMPKSGWFIRTEQRLDVLGTGDPAEILQRSNFVFDTLQKISKGAPKSFGPRTAAKIIQAESGLSNIPALFKPYQKAVKAVKGAEKERLSDFFNQLRDGDYSYMRYAPDESSFKALYAERYGAAPSDKAVKAYTAALDIADTSWNIKASARLKEVVAEGGEMITLNADYEALAYRVASAPQDELVLDAVTLRSYTKDTLPADFRIYKVPDTYLDHLYVTNVQRSRVANKVDVMPYNVGGPRDNGDFRWFLGSTREKTLASGNKVNTRFKTLMGSFGKSEIETAARELNTITARIKELIDAQGVKTIDDLVMSKSQLDDLEELISVNNKWNPNVETLDDLRRISKDTGFDMTEAFVFKARDQKVTAADFGTDVTYANKTFGELADTAVNARTLNGRRGDAPLLKYGGGKSVQTNPIAAIAEQFGQEVHGYANRAATRDAIDGWIALAESPAAKNLVEFPAGVPKSQYARRVLEAKVAPSNKANDLAAQLREQQRVLSRRLHQPTRTSEAWADFTRGATEFIFDATKGTVKWDLGKARPNDLLLQTGFYSKFGFFNPDQFFLQALHSVTIVAASPVAGAKAVSLALPIRLLASLSDDAALSLGIKRMAKTMGFDQKELEGIVRYIRESGRDVIDHSIIELQMPNKMGRASSLSNSAMERVRGTLDKSTFFFKEGERVTRTISMITAVLEHQAKRPNEDLFSPSAMRWIANREDDLTFNMTTASKPVWTQGILRVPTQWLAYSFKAMSAITVGREFTLAEKARMAAVLGPMWGMTGLGYGQATGYIMDKLGYDPNDPTAVDTFNFIKYGMGDWLLGEFLGTDTAYAERVAVIGAPIQTVKDLLSGSVIEALFGPSGQIGTDLVSGIVKTVSLGFGNRDFTFSEEVTKTLRNISTFDKIVKIRELIRSGDYLSRTYRQAAGNFEEAGQRAGAVAAVAFGATPAPVQNWYDFNEIIYSANDDYKQIETELLNSARAAIHKLNSSDPNEIVQGQGLWTETLDILWASPLSNELKLQIENRMMSVDQYREILTNAYKLGADAYYNAVIMEQQR